MLINTLAQLFTLAQQSSSSGSSGGGILGLCCPLIFLLVFIVIPIISAWKVFEKAGKPGWAAIVPVYNAVVLLEIIGRPIWWILLLFVPLVSIVISIIVAIDIAKSFGKSALFGVGLIFLPFIFFPLLAFGDAQYQGPANG